MVKYQIHLALVLVLYYLACKTGALGFELHLALQKIPDTISKHSSKWIWFFWAQRCSLEDQLAF
jgi:hypothetical protein